MKKSIDCRARQDSLTALPPQVADEREKTVRIPCRTGIVSADVIDEQLPCQPRAWISSNRAHGLCVLALLLTVHQAQLASSEEISTKRTTPIDTASADENAGGNVTITEDGAIELEDAEGVSAITVNSDHDVRNDGDIILDENDNIVAIEVEANRTSDVTNNGRISILEEYTREDEDDDGDLDGPLAIGSGRVGLLLNAGGRHLGDITTGVGSTIAIEGNDSAAISLRSDLVGDLTLDGNISVVGENALGVDVREQIYGNVLLSGSINVRGEGASAASFSGSVSGGLTIESSLSSTGFTSTSVSNYIAPTSIDESTEPVSDRIDAEDLNDGGPTLAIGGSLGQGLLINGAYDNFRSESDEEDETKDTIEDFDENRATGSVVSTGSAPAIFISPDWGNTNAEHLVLGRVREYVRDTTDDDEDEDFTEQLATFDYDYGFINRGRVAVNGLNVGYDATAVKVSGSSDGQYETRVEGGIYNKGAIQASAFLADAVAIDLNTGAIVPRFVNAGSIEAQTSTSFDDTAIGISIAPGAQLETIENSGAISVTTTGEAGSAIAILDESGTLSSLVNTNRIAAGLRDDGTVVENPGRAIAIDLRAHGASQGVMIEQKRNTPTEDKNGDDVVDARDEATPQIIGDILLGRGDDVFTSTAGSISGNVDFGAGENIFTLQQSTLNGDVRFGVGENTLSLNAAKLNGDLEFYSGIANLRLTNGSELSGKLSSSSTQLAVLVENSDLNLSADTNAVVDSFEMNGQSRLQLTISEQTLSDAAILTARQTAKLGPDVRVKVVFEDLQADAFQKVILSAAQLEFSGNLDETILQDTPYIYLVGLDQISEQTEKLILSYRLKTPSEMSLGANQTEAFDAVIASFVADDDLGAALTKITDAQQFTRTFESLTPHATDGVSRVLASHTLSGKDAIKQSIQRRDSQDQIGWRPWVGEYLTSMQVDPQPDAPGYDGEGVGFVFGLDRRLGGLDTFGIIGSFSSGDYTAKSRSLSPIMYSTLGAGLYLQEAVGAVDVTLVGQAYKNDFNSHRTIKLNELAYDVEGAWSGLSQSVNLDVSSAMQFASTFVIPSLGVDYFRLDQDGYNETGYETLTYQISSAVTEQVSAVADLRVGTQWEVSRNAFVIPEARLGYRTVLDYTNYGAEALLNDSLDPFEVNAFETYSDAVIFGLGLNTQSELLEVNIGYNLEASEESTIHRGSVSLRIRF